MPARDGTVLGYFLICFGLTESQRAADARRHLEQSLSRAIRQVPVEDPLANAKGKVDVTAAILANASLAAMDIADGNSAPLVAPLLEELEASTQRATAPYRRILRLES